MPLKMTIGSRLLDMYANAKQNYQLFSEGKVSPSSIPLQRCLRKPLEIHLTHNDFCVCWMWRMTDLPICPFFQVGHTKGVSSTNVPIPWGHQVFRSHMTSGDLYSNLLLKTGSAMGSYNIALRYIHLGLENLQG